MRVLIVKMSSMGDVLHTLPALTDAAKRMPGIRFDWIVEPAFQEIPQWHPAVDKVIPLSLRQLKKRPLKSLMQGSLRQAFKAIRNKKYDLVIDAQGLLKSALVTTLTHGPSVGHAKTSAREALASYFYKTCIDIPKAQHAILRTRQLFAKALKYDLEGLSLDYGLSSLTFTAHPEVPYVMFLHGTSWTSKEWPDQYWLELAQLLETMNVQVQLTWGTEAQRQRAVWLGRQSSNIKVLPQLTIQQAADVIGGAIGVVAVDTGFAHLATALERPMVGLFGATDANKTGVLGKNSVGLQATLDCSPCLKRVCPKPKAAVYPPCYQTLTPAMVVDQLKSLLPEELALEVESACL